MSPPRPGRAAGGCPVGCTGWGRWTTWSSGSSPRRPRSGCASEYATLPERLVVRELRYPVGQPGFRTRWVTLVTTLLDAELYPLQELAELYRRRWQAEHHLRDLKTTMNMDVLQCKTVEGVLKELHVFALVYNLVRVVLGGVAASRQSIGRLSFVDAVRWLRSAKAGGAAGQARGQPGPAGPGGTAGGEATPQGVRSDDPTAGRAAAAAAGGGNGGVKEVNG